MTFPVVIDASAGLQLLLSESGSSVVRERLLAWRRGRVPVLVPSHFWLEVANSLTRRHHVAGRVVIASIHHLDTFGLDTIELSRPLVVLALHHAERHGLSMYDAAYLALAESVDGLLFTAEKALLKAAADRGLSIEGGVRRLSERAGSYPMGAATWPQYQQASAFLAKLRSEARQPDEGRPRS